MSVAFNWWKAGEKEKTVAKMLWDDENLYVGYYCHDKHISASVTERHGPVSKDDCVEIFISPNPEKLKNYYTFEINEPKIFTAPIKAQIAMNATPGPLYEYACHEGNYGLYNILAGARAKEKADAAAK